MSLLYVNEHLSCIHYQKHEPPIKIFTKKKGEVFDKEILNDSKFLFLREGKMTVTFNGYVNELVNERQVLLLPTNSHVKITCVEDVHFLTFTFNVQVQLCASFSMTQLYPYYKESSSDFCVLAFNDHMNLFVDLLEHFIRDGVNCIHLYELKKQELFYIFRAYYEKEKLAEFFAPVLDREDVHFKKFILENCLLVKGVAELAQVANYSTSGFIKKFTRCFNTSPYRWIRQYKSDRILQDIQTGKKSFKEISDEYNFSSLPHFTEFCKKQYGSTPGRMRKKKENFDAKTQ